MEESKPLTAETVLAYVVGRLQALMGTTRAMSARGIKRELRDVLAWVETKSATVTVETVLADANPPNVTSTSESTVDGERRSFARELLADLEPDPNERLAPEAVPDPNEVLGRAAPYAYDATRPEVAVSHNDDEQDKEWLADAFRRSYLRVKGDEQPKCQEWARVCMMNEVPCIILREDGQFGPWVSLDGPLVGGPDSMMWGRAVDLLIACCVKTAGGDAVVAASLSGALESVDEAERLAKALVGLIVARRQSGEATSNGAGEP